MRITDWLGLGDGAPAGEEPTIDYPALAELQGLEGPHFFLHLVGVYLGTAPAQLAVMARALERWEPRPLEDAAHALKGASANFGARRLARLCARLQTAARAADQAGAAELLESARDEFSRVRAALRAATLIAT